MLVDISKVWYRQADYDLSTARLLLRNKRYDWASYAASQAAEKAVKSVLIDLGVDIATFRKNGGGHDTKAKLGYIAKLCFSRGEDALVAVDLLKNHNDQTRYPHNEESPRDTYSKHTATEAINAASTILAFCEKLHKKLGKVWRAS